MVQGLAFLSKKSWHTKNKAVQEQVWLAEERAQSEARKTAELAKQIQQEREQEELDRIAGKSDKKLDRGIDWMYHGQQANSEVAQQDAQKRNEEYLLGKELVPDGGAVKGDLDEGAAANEGVNKVIMNAAAAAVPQNNQEQDEPPQESQSYDAGPTVAERNEAFRLRTEDPMFAVQQRAAEKKRQLEKKKELYEKVVGGEAVRVVKGESSSSKKQRRSKKKESKKRKKKHRRRRAYSDEVSADGSSSSDREAHHKKRSRRRERSYSYDSRDDEDRHRRHGRYRRSRSRSPESPLSSRRHHRRRSPSWDRTTRDRQREQYHRSDEIHNDHYDRKKPATDRSHDEDRYCEMRESGRRHSHKDDHHRSSRSPHGDRKRDFNEEHGDSQKQPGDSISQKKAGYGLQGGDSFNKSSSSTLHRSNELGPSSDILKRKRDEKEIERRRMRETASTRRHKTAQEREAALREMETDAQRREEHVRHHQRDHHRRVDHESSAAPSRAHASFLHEMTQKTHGVGDEGISMSERLSQNRNSNQKSHESFL